MKKNNLSRKQERTKQFGLKVKEEFYWEVKKLALQEKKPIVKVIEDSVNFYRRNLRQSHCEQKKPERERERE